MVKYYYGIYLGNVVLNDPVNIINVDLFIFYNVESFSMFFFFNLKKLYFK